MNKQTNSLKKAFDGLWKMNLNFYKKLYKKTVNPLLLWDLYRLARKQKKPIPEEVLTYFDSISKHLLDQNRSEKDALGLKGFVAVWILSLSSIVQAEGEFCSGDTFERVVNIVEVCEKGDMLFLTRLRDEPVKALAVRTAIYCELDSIKHLADPETPSVICEYSGLNRTKKYRD